MCLPPTRCMCSQLSRRRSYRSICHVGQLVWPIRISGQPNGFLLKFHLSLSASLFSTTLSLALSLSLSLSLSRSRSSLVLTRLRIYPMTFWSKPRETRRVRRSLLPQMCSVMEPEAEQVAATLTQNARPVSGQPYHDTYKKRVRLEEL